MLEAKQERELWSADQTRKARVIEPATGSRFPLLISGASGKVQVSHVLFVWLPCLSEPFAPACGVWPISGPHVLKALFESALSPSISQNAKLWRDPVLKKLCLAKKEKKKRERKPPCQRLWRLKQGRTYLFSLGTWGTYL